MALASPRVNRGTECRSSRCFCILQPTVGRLSRRLFRPPSQRTDPDHAAEREEIYPGVGVPDRPERTKSNRRHCWSNGILYFTMPDNVWAVDARSGHRSGTTPTRRTRACTSGNAASRCTRTGSTSFARCAPGLLNANDGTLRWKVQVADATKGYWTTMAPLVVGNHVIIGVSGDFDNLQRISSARSIPRRARRNGSGIQHSSCRELRTDHGGMTWMTGTYDPRSQSCLLGNGQSDAGAEWPAHGRATTSTRAASSR